MTLHLVLMLGVDPSLTAFALATLLTYLLHSLIWCGAAALIARSRVFSPSTQSYLFLAALLGPVLTCALATGASSGRPQVRDLQLLSLAVATPASPAHDPSPAADGSTAARTFASNSSERIRALHDEPRVSARMLSGLLLALVAAAALGGLRFTLALLSLKRRMRDRVQLDDPRILQRLERLRSQAGLCHVALTQSSAIDVPLVLGRSEICLPVGSLNTASDTEIDAVLAHELAHIVRRDGVVFPLVGLVESIGWLHPVHHWVASRFRHAAELACDDRAVELTGDRLALAHALARVAQAAVSATRPLMLPAMARPRPASALLVRIRRLVRAPERTSARERAGWAVACCAALAVLTVGVSVRAARPPLAQPAAFVEPAAATLPTATEQIADLMARAEQLEREIARQQLSAASGAESQVLMLELQQQLRHVHETAAWIERESSERDRPSS